VPRWHLMMRPRRRVGKPDSASAKRLTGKKHAAELESEMLRRGMFFEAIDWSEDQATLPFEE